MEYPNIFFFLFHHKNACCRYICTHQKQLAEVSNENPTYIFIEKQEKYLHILIEKKKKEEEEKQQTNKKPTSGAMETKNTNNHLRWWYQITHEGDKLLNILFNPGSTGSLVKVINYSIYCLIHVLLNLDRLCLWKQCRSRSVCFWRSQMIWIYTVIQCVNLY